MLDRIQQRAQQFQVRRGLAWLVAALPLALGYVIGVVVKMAKLAWAAFVVGFEAGVRL